MYSGLQHTMENNQLNLRSIRLFLIIHIFISQFFKLEYNNLLYVFLFKSQNKIV